LIDKRGTGAGKKKWKRGEIEQEWEQKKFEDEDC
jgi:hypothetical protein